MAGAGRRADLAGIDNSCCNERTGTGVIQGTGDAWVDQHLADMGSYAQRYPASFIDEVARYTGTPRVYVQALLQVHGWRAGISIRVFLGAGRAAVVP